MFQILQYYTPIKYCGLDSRHQLLNDGIKLISAVIPNISTKAALVYCLLHNLYMNSQHELIHILFKSINVSGIAQLVSLQTSLIEYLHTKEYTRGLHKLLYKNQTVVCSSIQKAVETLSEQFIIKRVIDFEKCVIIYDEHADSIVRGQTTARQQKIILMKRPEGHYLLFQNSIDSLETVLEYSNALMKNRFDRLNLENLYKQSLNVNEKLKHDLNKLEEQNIGLKREIIKLKKLKNDNKTFVKLQDSKYDQCFERSIYQEIQAKALSLNNNILKNPKRVRQTIIENEYQRNSQKKNKIQSIVQYYQTHQLAFCPRCKRLQEACRDNYELSCLNCYEKYCGSCLAPTNTIHNRIIHRIDCKLNNQDPCIQCQPANSCRPEQSIQQFIQSECKVDNEFRKYIQSKAV